MARLCVFCQDDKERENLKAEVQRLTVLLTDAVGRAGDFVLLEEGCAEWEHRAKVAEKELHEKERKLRLVGYYGSETRVLEFDRLAQAEARAERLEKENAWLKKQLSQFTGVS
jgi:hypothetical protein